MEITGAIFCIRLVRVSSTPECCGDRCWTFRKKRPTTEAYIIKIALKKYYLSLMEQYPIYWPQFYTATILEWKPLLKPDKYKDVIIESLRYLTTNKKITLYAFVIMNNHIHLIWQALPDKTPEQIQHSFMKYTAQQIKFDLVQNHPLVLDKFRVNAKDRTY